MYLSIVSVFYKQNRICVVKQVTIYFLDVVTNLFPKKFTNWHRVITKLHKSYKVVHSTAFFLYPDELLDNAPWTCCWVVLSEVAEFRNSFNFIKFVAYIFKSLFSIKNKPCLPFRKEWNTWSYSLMDRMQLDIRMYTQMLPLSCCIYFFRKIFSDWS